MVLPRFMALPNRLTPLTPRLAGQVRNVDPYPIALLDPATIPA
jgi:hypothetical protein